MLATIYVIDAFTDRLFSGNPAAVCPLPAWPEDELMQQIAAENNLSETAFVVHEGNDFRIRWFTPKVEVDLCGHATLAAAHCLFTQQGYERNHIRFHSKSGVLTVTREDYGRCTLDFPADPPSRVDDPPPQLFAALGIPETPVWKGRFDLMVELKDTSAVSTVKPDFKRLASIPTRGVIVTARGVYVDFVSRGFFPACGIDEDPVTGSAHCLLTPFWAERLGKTSLHARQISKRSGEMVCHLNGDRVRLTGRAVLYLKGQIRLS